MNERKDTSEPSRRGNIASAWSIAAIVVLMLVMILHHPIASRAGAGGVMASIARQASVDRWVHGSLAAAMTVMTALMIGFAMRLGARRPHVLFGIVASGLGLVLVCLAVLLDGFIAPAMAERCMTIGGDCARETQPLLRYTGLQIEFLTRAGLIAMAVSAAAWAGEIILRRDEAFAAGVIGLASSALQLGMLLLNDAQLRPHSLALVVAAQAAWYLSVASVMGFGRGPYRPSER